MLPADSNHLGGQFSHNRASNLELTTDESAMRRAKVQTSDAARS